jgi:hypothetical protein
MTGRLAELYRLRGELTTVEELPAGAASGLYL